MFSNRYIKHDLIPGSEYMPFNLETEEMIVSSETQEFVPFGRDYIRHHPGQFQVKRSGGPPSIDLSTPLTKSFKDISLHEPIAVRHEFVELKCNVIKITF